MKPLGLFPFIFAPACEGIFIKTHSVDNRRVIGPENTPFAGECVHFPDRKFYMLGAVKMLI